MYFVYLLRCADGTLYTGCTNDLDRRLAAHNAGKGAKYTRSRRPVVLVYREQAAERSAACWRPWPRRSSARGWSAWAATRWSGPAASGGISDLEGQL